MLKSFTHQSQRLNVNVKVVEIQSKTKIDSAKTLKCQISRSNDIKTSSFVANQPLNLYLNFIGTFYLGKSKAKEKDVVIMLYIDNNKKINGQLTLNVSEFVDNKNITHECTRRVLFNGGMYTIQIHVVISDEDSCDCSSPPIRTTSKVTPNNSVLVHKCGTRVPSPPGNGAKLSVVRQKKDLRQTRSMTSLNTLVNTDIPLSPRRMRGESRLDSPSRRVIPSKLPPDTKKNGYSQTLLRGKVAHSTLTPDTSESESDSYLSNFCEDVEFTEKEKQFFQDISGYASILEIEDEIIQKGNTQITYPLLAQVVWKTIEVNSLITMETPLFNAIVYEIEKMMNDDVIQLRQLAYLQSTMIWISLLIAGCLKEERDVRVMASFNVIVKETIKCQTILINFIKKGLSDAIQKWLNKQEETSILTSYIEKVIGVCKRMNFPQTVFTIMMNDIVKLINEVVAHEISHSSKITMDGGIYLQIIGSFIVELFERNSIDCDMPLIKELSAVLIIQNKDILSTNECSEICPHLPKDILVALLNNLKEKYPDCMSIGTITLIGKEKDQFQYYDTSLDLLKYDKIKEIIKESCCDHCINSNLSVAIPLFTKRDYLQPNGLLVDI